MEEVGPRCCFDVCPRGGVVRLRKRGVGWCYACVDHAARLKRKGWVEEGPVAVRV